VTPLIAEGLRVAERAIVSMLGTMFNELILGIYQAAEAPSLWPAALEQLRRVLNGSGVTMQYFDLDAPASQVAASVGYAPEDLQLYQDYYSRVDPWGLALATHALSPGLVIDGRALAPDAEVVRSEFFTDFGRRIGAGRCLCVPLEPVGTRAALVVVGRSHTQPCFEDRDLAALGLLSPHLQQAFRLHRRLVRADVARLGAEGALERLGVGVILTDGTGAPLALNAEARRIADDGDGLTIDGRGVRGLRLGVTRRFEAAVAAARSGTLSTSITAFAVERPSCRKAYRVLVAPAGPALLPGMSEARATVAVFVTDPEVVRVEEPSRLIEMFGLTRAEAAVTAQLVNGATPEVAARELGVRVGTVRWQLKQVMQKLHVRTQAQLVSLVLSSPASFRK
jgi:DNA-binding CsgD family transcriptional regulator